MPQVVRRLPPTFSTLRDLFVRSGNECAFPGCDRVLVNHKGQWVGEVCHMHAALPGGERFNSDMSNEERRDRSNLLLMCHDHHVETNDVAEFSVERLVEIKNAHEARFSGAPPIPEPVLEQAVQEIVAASIEDVTDRVVLRLPQTLDQFHAAVGFQETAEELEGTLALLTPAFEALRRLPVDTRAVFAILVDRSPVGSSVTLPLHEIEFATQTTPDELSPHVEMLERHHIAGLEESWRDDRPTHWLLSAFDLDGWDFWSAFRVFCDRHGLRPKEVINELRFDLLN
jgi:hypothetical protein